MSSSDESLMTPAEVATFLRKSKSWVYAACERGALPQLRVGRDLRFRRADLERWLEAQTKTTAPVTLKGES